MILKLFTEYNLTHLYNKVQIYFSVSFPKLSTLTDNPEVHLLTYANELTVQIVLRNRLGSDKHVKMVQVSGHLHCCQLLTKKNVPIGFLKSR